MLVHIWAREETSTVQSEGKDTNHHASHTANNKSFLFQRRI